MYLPWIQEGVDFFILGRRKSLQQRSPPLSDNKNLRERETRFSYPMMIGANGLMKNLQVPTRIDDDKNMSVVSKKILTTPRLTR